MCLRESVDRSVVVKGQQQGFSLEEMTMSFRQLSELVEKVEQVQTVKMIELLEKHERTDERGQTKQPPGSLERWGEGGREVSGDTLTEPAGADIQRMYSTLNSRREESDDNNKEQQQDYRLDLMAASIRQLTELNEKLERRVELLEKEQKGLTKQDKIAHEKLKVDPVEDETISGQQESPLEKRSDDTASWEPVVAQVTQRLNLAEANIEALKNSVVAEQQTRGTVYVRWGNSICPSSAETVYSGVVGGSWYNEAGAASNYLCLPHDPTFDDHTIPRYGNAKLYGAEYQTCDEHECDYTPSCAVCRISRESSVMLPARNACYPGWTLEYSGYIMASHPTHLGGTEYICVDSSRNYTEGSVGDQNGALLYYTAYVCGSLPCPPYFDNRVVVCVVCSK